MKSAYLCTAFLLWGLLSEAQQFSFAELLNLTSINTDRFLNTVEKKGYRPVRSGKNFVTVFYPKDSLGERYLIKQVMDGMGWLKLEKLTPEEYALLRQTVETEGFYKGKTSDKVYTELFEKKDVTITAAPENNPHEGKQWYNVVIEKRILPKLRELIYAEDLLAFNSHQQLQEVFGARQVTKDKYLNPDGTAMNCSVIYPGTSKEAVFLWKDPENMRDLGCIRIGGNKHTSGSFRYSNQVALNQWRSKQGIYATMTLQQLQVLNQSPVRFYGWGGGASGTLCKDNQGRIDFKTLDLALDCFNCNDDAYFGKYPHQSDEALEENRRIYVTTMIFYPPAHLKDQ